MSKILLVTSSMRTERAADNIIKIAQTELAKDSSFELSVADLRTLNIPFLDTPLLPSDENFKTEGAVAEWSKLVSDSDVVIFLAAEYNHSFTSALKNAIDWLYTEWNSKPVRYIGYGWVGGARSIAALRLVMASNLAAKATENEANLRFMKEINIDGSVIDQEAVSASIKSVVDELKNTIG